jgi:hypothetical protein
MVMAMQACVAPTMQRPWVRGGKKKKKERKKDP